MRSAVRLAIGLAIVSLPAGFAAEPSARDTPAIREFAGCAGYWSEGFSFRLYGVTPIEAWEIVSAPPELWQYAKSLAEKANGGAKVYLRAKGYIGQEGSFGHFGYALRELRIVEVIE